MNNFTFSDFEKLSKEEAKLQRLLEKHKEGKMKSPDKKAVDTILAYSKSVSIKKSASLDYLEHILN
jgi:hypothetical protein